MTQESDLQHLSGFGELRKRYLRVALPISALAYFVRSVEPATPVATRIACIAMLLFCIAALKWLPRSKDDALRLTRAMLILVVLVLLGIAWGDIPRGFPFGLVLLPGLALFGTLIGGAWLGAGVAGIGVAASLSLFAIYPLDARPPFLVQHVANVCISIFITYPFALVLAERVREGATDLAKSTAVLQATRQATQKLSHDLSQRVASAVVELKSALDAGDDAVMRAAEATGTLLAESQRAVPAEPALVETQLETHMAELRSRVAKWAFRVVLFGGSALFLRTILAPVDKAPIAVVPISAFTLAVLALLTLLDELRPRWFRTLFIAFNVFIAFILSYFAATWSLWKPGLPPTVVLWNVVPLLATAVVGLELGLFQVVLAVVVILICAWPYAALSWTVPVDNALACGLICWLLWRAPRDLIALLSAQHAAAAAEIRQRRRLIATLFHDLASPLLVVQATSALAAEGLGEPDDAMRTHEMVDRMQSILKAATGEGSDVSAVEAGRVFDAMEALFRERLRAKGLVLTTRGPREARVLCREALLTESVLGNLLSNAVKFSPSGGAIELRVEEQRGSVLFVVEDRGAGLPSDVRVALSKGLTSVSRPGTGGEQGNGYGLMLAQDYVRDMKGTLELEERAGGGLSARIRLQAG